MKYKIINHTQLTENVFKLIIEGNTSTVKRAGQFVNIQIDNFYLRRPISVCDYDDNTITLIYKILGEGTEALSKYRVGDYLDLLVGLGNGFNVDAECQKPLVIGGGVGVPPLYNLTKKLLEKGKNPTLVICFNTEKEIFLYNEFKNLGLNVFVATLDGSFGTKGYFSNVIKENCLNYDYYYACGNLPMIKNIHSFMQVEGQISFEERMGCGFGGCMGCSIKTRNGYKKVCTDTVLLSNEVIFN